MFSFKADAHNPAFDNSDVLAPATALQLMTDRVTENLVARGVEISENNRLNKNGKCVVNIPMGFKKTQLRDAYQKTIRMVSIKDAGAPHTPLIREEFEIAAVTAYRNNSHHVFYIEAMLRCFFSNMTVEMSNSAVGYELNLQGAGKVDKSRAQLAYVTAFDNVIRFHPLYVAYLYGASGDVEREDLIIEEVCSYLAWLFQNNQ